MRGRRNPPLDFTAVPEGTPLTFDVMARAYLKDYQLQHYRTMNTVRTRVVHLRELLEGWTVDAMTADAVRWYQLHRRTHGVVKNLFRVGRHLLRTVHHRLLRTQAFVAWDAVTCGC